MRLLRLLLLLCSVEAARGALGAPPTLVLNASLPGSGIASAVFTEGGPPAALARPGELRVTATDAALSSAVVQLTNPLDAPDELLAVAAVPCVASAYDSRSGVLTLNATAECADPTAALQLALSGLAYSNSNAQPDASQRVLIFLLLDAVGASSTPTVATVTVRPVNTPPVLVLASPATVASGGGVGYGAVLLERERTTPVALADAALSLRDPDSAALPRAVVVLSGALDGDAETLEADVAGTSVRAAFAAGTLLLEGLDSVAQYARVLASVRYRNPGSRDRVTGALVFTTGLRNVTFTVFDDGGASASVTSNVTCVAQPRTGVAGYDPNVAAPPPCGGHGAQSFDNQTGVAACACDSGYEGDQCEIPPCLAHGAYDPLQQTCACYQPYSGANCSTMCSGGGVVLSDGSSCACFPGRGGANCSLACLGCVHGVCTQAGAAITCGPCDPGWAGANCSLPCPCYAGAGLASGGGNCTVAAGGLSAYCACSPGRVGPDCSGECPACATPGGTCTLPAAAPSGLTGLLAALSALALASAGGAVATLAAIAGHVSSGLLGNGSVALNATSLAVLPTPAARLFAACSCASGYAGADCGTPCAPCSAFGTCSPLSGTCVCLPGYSGATCASPCSGHGALAWPALSTTFTAADWDAANGPNLVGPYTSPGGLFDTSLLYGTSSPDSPDAVLARCACAAPPAAGGPPWGYVGPFCEVPCGVNCGAHGACTLSANGSAVCACDRVTPNGAATTSQLALASGLKGLGWTGADCSLPCQPCANGTCSAATGACACTPGFSDGACAVECGSVALGSKGTLAPAGALVGYGLDGGTGLCVCTPGWAGPSCTSPCPYPYNASHGLCTLKNSSAVVPSVPSLAWLAEVVCAPGWSGTPSAAANPTGAPGRSCDVACAPCDAAGGECTDAGQCACAYGYLWQGPLGASAAQYPYPQLRLPGGVFNASYHSCATPHPCSANGEYINATCAGTILPGTQQPWTQAEPLDGGWGLASGVSYFAMAYSEVDATTGLAARINPPPATFSKLGTIQGGVCLPAAGAAAGTLPLRGGVCRCDNIQRGRFSFPSATYDVTFQGWAGADCSIPCAPCSENGACDSFTGACVCSPGWAGYMCRTPCEPCSAQGGTCIADGSCLCGGPRRGVEGTYALRLTRDPFYGPSGGVHTYLVAGRLRSEYVPPAYATAGVVEDYLWEVELECSHRPSCVSRTPDTQLPVRPNETYFRYTTPQLTAVGTTDANSPVVRLRVLDASIAALKAAVEAAPYSLNASALCDVPGPNVGQEIVVGQCLAEMSARLWGRTLEGCGASYDASRPWLCDDNLKAQFVLAAQLQIGRLQASRAALASSASQAEQAAAAASLTVSRWQTNNVGERQRLVNTQLRGVFNASSLSFVTTRSAGPDYYMVWVLHQLLYGVTYSSGGVTAYAGWNCSVPCLPCDPQGGTCQFDGTCECIPGRYGADCSLQCACASSGSDSGGVCGRDGACVCHTDTAGISWGGPDCATPCHLCAHGVCSAADGSCVCDPGWLGDACNVANSTECAPCSDQHGACLSDGSCTCDAGWTGLDCSVPCAPCVHGSCMLDGSCLCHVAQTGLSGSAGWALADCSLLLGAPLARTNFTVSAAGWRALNNSCAATALAVRGGAVDLGGPAASASALASDCVPAANGVGGDAGLGWDPSTGCLVLADELPFDSFASGELAYLRAPPPFLGNQLRAYGGALAWSMHSVAGDPAGAAAHPARYAPDAVLLGGLPLFNLTPPALAQLSKLGVVAWSRARFPELGLNPRWSRSRLRHTLQAYLSTPQLVLHYYAPRPGGASASVSAPLPGCVGEVCPLNFAATLAPEGGWLNAPGGLPPGPWRWAGSRGGEVDPGRSEGTPFVTLSPSASGPRGHNPFDAAATLHPGGGDAAAQERVAQGGAADGGVPVWTVTPGDAYPGQTWTDARGVTQVTPGFAVPADWRDVGGRPGNSFGVAWAGPQGGGGGDDVLSAVRDAVARARASHAGQPASAADISWCLASLQEVLLRADYSFAAAPSRGAPFGPAEAVRLDDLVLAAPTDEAALGTAMAAEQVAWMEYVHSYADAYQSALMQTLAELADN